MINEAINPQVWEYYAETIQSPFRLTWLGSGGGSSGSLLWLVDQPEQRLLLRAWPPEGSKPARLDQIHRWLSQVRHPFIPQPIAGLGGSTWYSISGRLWELVPFLPGEADLARPPATAHLIAMFSAIARFHQAATGSWERGLSPGLIARRDELDRLLDGEFATFDRALDRQPNGWPVDLARRWLNIARVMADQVIGPVRSVAAQTHVLGVCIRDVRPDHFLFEGDRLSGLVDFGAMGVDVPETDLARLLGETVGRDDDLRAKALSTYAKNRTLAGGLWELDAGTEDRLHRIEAANAILGGARWVRWHFVERRRFADPEAVTHGLLRTLRRLEEWAGRGASSDFRTRRA